MRRLRKNDAAEKVCISIVERNLEKALHAIRKANPLADLIELRVDYMRNPELSRLVRGGRKPFIITNRRREEGGRFQGDEGARVRILEQAVGLDVDYVDVEMGTERSLIRDLIVQKKAKKRRTKIILSFHDFNGTPSRRELQKRCDQMSRLDADVAKIVTFAQSWEDNLNVLALIPYAKEREQKIIAFCMGQRGKMSRVIAPLVGAAWTYASLSAGRASAPGQIPVRKMREIWERVR